MKMVRAQRLEAGGWKPGTREWGLGVRGALGWGWGGAGGGVETRGWV